MASQALMRIALALAFLSQAVALVHMGVVRHETCAEHGELVEGDGHGDAPTPPDPNAAEGDEHDHCLVASNPSVVDLLTAVTPSIDVSSLTTDVVAPRARIASVDVLRAAPKTSPPLA